MATLFSGKIIYVLMLISLKSMFYATTLVKALELPAQLLNDGADGNLLKTKEYAGFPLAADVDVELPLSVEETVNLTNEEQEAKQQQLLPPWLQMPMNHQQQQQQQQQQQEPQQRISSGSAKAFIKMAPNQQQQQQQMLTSKHSQARAHTHAAAGVGERRCSIEISSKIPGVCQPMSHIGSACVSGEYMEVFNDDCM